MIGIGKIIKRRNNQYSITNTNEGDAEMSPPVPPEKTLKREIDAFKYFPGSASGQPVCTVNQAPRIKVWH